MRQKGELFVKYLKLHILDLFLDSLFCFTSLIFVNESRKMIVQKVSFITLRHMGNQEGTASIGVGSSEWSFSSVWNLTESRFCDSTVRCPLGALEGIVIHGTSHLHVLRPLQEPKGL